MTTAVPTSAELHAAWDALNTQRTKRGLLPLSYTDLAHCVESQDSTNCEPMKCSKSLAYHIMTDRYTAATAPAYRKRIAEIIRVRAAELDLVVLATAIKAPRRRPAQVRVVRCSPNGYIKLGRRTYYAGSPFSGSRCMVGPVKSDSDKAVRITCGLATRIAYPVDPSTSQLPEAARA